MSSTEWLAKRDRVASSPGTNVELAVRTREVRLHGTDAHEQLRPDLAVPSPRRSQLGNLLLRLRQLARCPRSEADPRALRPRPVREQPDTGPLEDLEGTAERMLGLTLVLGTPRYDPTREQRAAELERLPEALAQADGPFEHRLRFLESALPGEEQPVAALACCERPSPPDGARPLQEPRQQLVRLNEAAELDERLHLVGHEPERAWLGIARVRQQPPSRLQP